MAPEAECIMQNQSTLCIEKRFCFDVSLVLNFKMLADLPSGHVFHSHALYVKIILDVINYFARRRKERDRDRDREWGEGGKEKERNWQM